LAPNSTTLKTVSCDDGAAGGEGVDGEDRSGGGGGSWYPDPPLGAGIAGAWLPLPWTGSPLGGLAGAVGLGWCGL